MKALVTGGAGFIGSHVAEAYLKAGFQVTVVDNLSTGDNGNLPPGVEFIEADIGDRVLSEIIKTGGFDLVNHHAAQIDVRASVKDPVSDARTNILGSLNLLEACRAAGIKKFIFASTGGAIYGEQDYFPANEEHPQRPVSPYGITKLSVEKYLYYYRLSSGMVTVVLRYGNVYGPRQNAMGEAGVMAIFARKMLLGQEPVINGDGLQTRDYVYVGDVARANLLAAQRNQSGVFNIGTGKETNVIDVFHLLRDALFSTVPDVYGPPAPGEQRRSVLDWAKAEKEMGWRPAVGLKEGIGLTADYFRKRYEAEIEGGKRR